MPKNTNQKGRILKVALKLFAQHVYASTPISQIARTAKVSQGLMYNFFAGKEALLQDMMTAGFEDIRASMSNYQSEKDPQQAIALHVRKTMQIIRDHKEFWRLLHAIRLQGKVSALMQQAFRQVTDEATNTFLGVFKKMGYKNPQLEAILFLTQIDGLVMLFLQDQRIPLEQLAEQLINRYKK